MYKALVPLRRSDRDLIVPPYGSWVPKENPMVVSIAPIEAPALSGRFPIAWRKGPLGWDLVCLCGLTPEHDCLRPSEQQLRSGAAPEKGNLPILIAAYPFAVADDGTSEALTILREAGAHADTNNASSTISPSPALNDDGEPIGEGQRRCEALWTFVQSRRQAASLERDLEAAGAFVPWDLDLARAGLPVHIDGLFVIASAFFGSKAHRSLVEAHGWPAANLLTVHRISLFRVGDMVSALQAARA